MEEDKTNPTVDEGEIGDWEFDPTDTGFIIIVILFSIIGVGACLMWWFLCRKCQCTDRGSGGRSHLEDTLMFQRHNNIMQNNI